MRILIDIWSLATENGGPTRSSKGLAKALAQTGAEVVLMSHVPGKVLPGEIVALKSQGVEFVEGRGNGYFTAIADSRRVLAQFRPDVVHVQGLWKLSTHAMCVVARKLRIPIVISPRGMLDPWAFGVKKWKKRLGLFLYQRRDLEQAAALHATAEMEAGHIRGFGLVRPVVVVPNGVDFPSPLRSSASLRSQSQIPNLPISNPEPSISQSKISNPPIHTALFLSRLHPGKGLLLLADAWAKVCPAGWKMVVAGPDEGGHRAEVEAKLRQLGVADDWIFTGEVDDERKWRLYRDADLFVHPSASENFGISIAEALASGVPVIATKGAPWNDLVVHKCGWWVERTAENLAETLKSATSLADGERMEMGERGRALVLGKYAWPAIAKRMAAEYGELTK